MQTGREFSVCAIQWQVTAPNYDWPPRETLQASEKGFIVEEAAKENQC